jgi:hypothetical protein
MVSSKAGNPAYGPSEEKPTAFAVIILGLSFLKSECVNLIFSKQLF